MSRIEVKSFVKINLSIDVGKVEENGYHPVDMVMQQLSFHDDVTVEYTPYSPGAEGGRGAACADGGSFDIEVKTNRYYLPVDRRNLAYQAAELMAGRFGKDREGTIRVDIHKRIPVAGGLAGGSGNAAAVIHALNILWDLKLSLKELMTLGEEIGSDVPYCIMGQARANRVFPEYLKEDPEASSCARAKGRGTVLRKAVPLKSWIVIAKPRFSVSTREVYDGIDKAVIKDRPDNDRLEQAMKDAAEAGGTPYAVPGVKIYRDCINVLEEYTLKAYPEVAAVKEMLVRNGAEFALMSGSGPTVFGIFASMKGAVRAAELINKEGVEAYWTRTTL